MILDAGVWLAALDSKDRFFASARALINNADADRDALDLTLYEVTNVAVRRWGDRDAADRVCRLIIAASDDNLIRIDTELAQSAARIATEEGLTAYDASYVAAARQSQTQLVSTDLADLVRPGLAVPPDAL